MILLSQMLFVVDVTTDEATTEDALAASLAIVVATPSDNIVVASHIAVDSRCC
jgi:hypothetical protein